MKGYTVIEYCLNLGKTRGTLHFNFSVKWFDMWIGVFIDKVVRQSNPETWRIYICPIPMMCFRIAYRPYDYWS